MPTLRISHVASQVEIRFEGDGPLVIERRPFTFTLTPQDEEDIRWYLEDYRIYPVEPAPKIAKRIEQRMGEVGRELFRLVLKDGDPWTSARHSLYDTRIEIVHNQLGNICADGGQIEATLHHYRESVRHCETMQDRFGAGQTRQNAAIVLARAGRPADAREWAQSALRDYQACGNVDEEVVRTLKLLEAIESGLQASSPPS